MGDVRQTEMHIAEPFLPERSASEVKAAIGKLKRCKLPGVDSKEGKHFILKSCLTSGKS
jgi:hypothetical protein